MPRRNPNWSLATAICCVACFFVAECVYLCAEEPSVIETYEKQVKPLLRDRCYACHGALKQEGGLRLDTAASILRGGDSGAAAIAENAASSPIIRRVSTTNIEERMPPEHEGEPLTSEHIAVLSRWITAGAIGPQDEEPESDPRAHWAFQSIVRPSVPQVSSENWALNPIDAFVAERHEALHLQPVRRAPRTLLMRRLWLDMVGVPPSMEELGRFATLPDDEWYEQAVEKLLNDPRYGERWGRHWMDIWRYSDWWGLGDQLRNSQKHIWHWRDWIIDSLNDNVPYDEMVRQMLAGDELYPNDLSKLRATGYLARNYFLFNRNQWMDETVEHVSKGFLGLTMNCAKCHDHKYDPISQVDYYRMRAFFEPYHVRLDIVPGETDANRDGIPRAFDGYPDAVTYRFERGEESRPVKSVALSASMPSLFDFAEANVKPVELPQPAYRPGLRPWIGEANTTAAENRLQAAISKADAAEKKVVVARKLHAELLEKSPSTVAENDSGNQPAGTLRTKAPPHDLFKDTFDAFNKERWSALSGQWSHQPGRMEQRRDGASRSVLRYRGPVPQDFDAELVFTTHGGSQWRSVGISFDATQDDVDVPSRAADTEHLVYVSAVAGGSKIQASYLQNQKTVYPQDAMAALPVELGKPHTLRIQVRDRLIHAWLDGQRKIIWQSPLNRVAGHLQIIAFDALVDIDSFSIASLSPDVKLARPKGMEATVSAPEEAAAAVEVAIKEQLAARTAIRAAELDVEFCKLRAEADKLKLQNASSDEAREAAVNAATAERKWNMAKAEQRVAEANVEVLKAANDKREKAEAEKKAADEALAKLSAETAPTGDQYTPQVGAVWTPTRFFNSGKDDPEVTFPAVSSGRRRALAEWITHPKNPLTARVAVNHIWARHFGTPLVSTVFEFGRKGNAPTHLELLNWLAAELIESGWDMKHIHRLILQSETYQMSSIVSGKEAAYAIDPDNKHLWHRTAGRLESQVVRDTILHLAGSLDEKIGGPTIPADKQADSKRRSLYFFHSNNERNLFLMMFDEALVKDCYRREQSIVPQQALALSNSRVVLDAVEPIAAKIEQAAAKNQPQADDSEEYIRAAFRYLLATEPTDDEVSACITSMQEWTTQSTGDAAASRRAAHANLVWVLLNHHDFVTVN